MLRSRPLLAAISLSTLFLPSMAFAAEADAGRDIALRRCSPCHVVASNQRNEVALAPSFDVIAKKNGFDAGMLVFSLLEPHPKMNLALTQREASSLAAYISTLAK
jgi:mono/diheme cytochrome c family protein